ncbi:hypothetical protein [Paracoccus mutanolyticus]|uniref:hypothetical protein n=1 Tax=Paracoccus mutanolyticus TaxID=1499308 RepID=UPI00167BAD47|nr:hypothetical protein [Paracoccus mutanolyticus]
MDPREPVRQDRPGPWPSETGARPARLSRTGAVFALTGGAALALPFAQFKPNRIVAGDAIGWAGALVQPVGSALAAALALLLAAGLGRGWATACGWRLPPPGSSPWCWRLAPRRTT